MNAHILPTTLYHQMLIIIGYYVGTLIDYMLKKLHAYVRNQPSGITFMSDKNT